MQKNIPEIRCYERCGFEGYCVGPMVLYYVGVYYDELLMAKVINLSKPSRQGIFDPSQSDFRNLTNRSEKNFPSHNGQSTNPNNTANLKAAMYIIFIVFLHNIVEPGYVMVYLG
jgi:hypothetical protein